MISAHQLRSILRLWASGVTLVTAQHEGVLHGMTVSAFCSVSLEPPLVSVNIERGTRTYRLMQDAGRFAVCVLAEGQHELSHRFGGGLPDEADRFTEVDYSIGELGAPIPRGCLAVMECETAAAHPAGTHTVFIGQVHAVHADPAGSPLLYFNREYRKLAGD